MKTDVFREQRAWNYGNMAAAQTNYKFDDHDITILRQLAHQTAEIAASADMAEKASRWYAHNDMKSQTPVIYVDLEDGWNEVMTDDVIQCHDPVARAWENWLRKRLYNATVLKDDTVVTDTFDVAYAFTEGSWGFEVLQIGGNDGGSFRLESSFDDYDRLDELHFPTITIDWEKSDRLLELAHQVFDGILKVRRYMNWHWAYDYINKFMLLRGYEEFLCDCAVEKEGLMAALDMIAEGMNARLDWLEKQQVLHLNNGAEVIGTGGLGFTNELPAAGFNGTVRTQDMWGCVQAQETLTISPDTFGEIFLPHIQKVAKRFGRVYYGCCEVYNTRWQYVKQIPNLKKVSVSPWADFTTVPEYLGMDYIAAVKLSPTQVCIPNMNEKVVREECRHAVDVTRGGCCEFILKNTTTLSHKPENAVRWTQIMREEIGRFY